MQSAVSSWLTLQQKLSAEDRWINTQTRRRFVLRLFSPSLETFFSLLFALICLALRLLFDFLCGFRHFSTNRSITELRIPFASHHMLRVHPTLIAKTFPLSALSFASKITRKRKKLKCHRGLFSLSLAFHIHVHLRDLRSYSRSI